MSKLKKLAGVLSFAHLHSPQAAHVRAESDPDKDEDKDGKKGKRAEGDDDQRDDEQGKKGSRAEGDDKDNGDDDDADGKKGKRAEGDDDKGDDDQGKKGSRAEDDGGDGDEDDDDEEMHGKSAVAAARRRERSRCAAIMGSRHAAKNVPFAANLAFNTTMTRRAAIEALRSAPAAAAPDSHSVRAARNPNLGAGGDQAPDPKASKRAGWDRAMSKARGRR